MSISFKLNRIILQSLSAASLATAIAVSAQAPATSAATAPATPPAAPADAAAAPAPLSTFVLTGPLDMAAAGRRSMQGPLGKLSVNGILTGFFAVSEQITCREMKGAQATLTNGEIFIQKADGKVQYFVQAGVYTMQRFHSVSRRASYSDTNFYGPVPVAFLKLPVGKTTQFHIGSLPTLMGAESTFTYQNFNVERGIVWNQENAINRGIQVNQALGKYLSASVSWNDGYYSDRYSWLSGLCDFYQGTHTLVYDGMGNLGTDRLMKLLLRRYRTTATCTR